MSQAPTTFGLIRWLTSITRSVHRPLLFSALMRIVTLSLDIVLFGLVAGGTVAIVTHAGHAPAIIGWLVVVAVVKALASYLEQFSGHYVAFKALELLRPSVFGSLWPKAPGVVTKTRSGDLLASLTRDVDRIEVFYAHTFAPLVSAYVVAPAACIVTGCVVGWRGVVIPLICVVLALTVVPFAGVNRSLEATAHSLAARRELAHHVSDSLFGKDEVTGYGRESERIAGQQAIDDAVAASAGVSRRQAAIRRGAGVALLLISTLSIALMSDASPVVQAALIGGSLRLFEGPKGVEDAVGYLDHSFAAARRLWQIVHAPASVADGPATCALTGPVGVEWHDVSYAYDREGAGAGFGLKGVTMTAPAGGHTVIVGPSGSGKTTALTLLLRYADPDSGTITLGGRDIRDFTLDSLRRCVVFVPQRCELMNTSIRENLLLAAPDASDEEVWEALRLAGLDDEVHAMPRGLDTPVGADGEKLSGGQAQRLTLARAMIEHPRVLVLDEFTASLNEERERMIRDTLAALPGDLTVIEVTHTLRDPSSADAIVAFDNGRIVPWKDLAADWE